MDPGPTPPNTSSDVVLQPVPPTTPGLPRLLDAPETHELQAPMAPPRRPSSSLTRPEDAIAQHFPKRPMVPTSASDWESRKQTIRELYMDQNIILNEVIEIMITKHKFKATARMYKGQFAKWKWTKYNKSGNHGSVKPSKSRAAKKKSINARKASVRRRQSTPTQTEQLVPLSQHPYLQYFNDEEGQVETTLSAYAALICHWSERETPWKTESRRRNRNSPSELYEPRHHSILQHVRSAQDYFLAGHPQQGGDMLRRAFLGIETALECGLDVEALWDCCLAVPQLVLTTGWTDLLPIFARYLHQYTTIRLAPHHPLTKIAAALHRLARDLTTTTTTTTPAGASDRQRRLLEAFVARGWALWIDCVTRVRGRHDDVTIHLKRGYVTLVDPRHGMAADILDDFGRAVQESLARRGACATTARILELENLLVRMYLPLFTPATAAGAEEVLRGLVGRIEGKPWNRGRAVGEWAYVDRYLVFSANYFMASIAEYGGQDDKAAVYRGRSLDSPRDLFWLQTSLLVESRLRAGGRDGEADLIQEARTEAQSVLRVIELGGIIGG
ncbi:hypothetical protein C8A00DRAFT_11767 [Chaetomidium leptoderma]|uniref:Clr5 domain-containing protein n=1 Tax=Chaetomidium leptoderma TaxID=669021 RepID=A0AAN6VV46_9PEZI|nr:hypothetical protein C8A00DRAFT_11767 [Chaetomidium leptoderma]